MKKRSIIYGVALLIIMLVGSGSLAYFSYDQNTHNIISTGAVRIQIVRRMINADNQLTELPDTVFGLMPGESSSYRLSVKNTGKSTAWIRVKPEISITDSKGDPLPETLSDGSSVIRLNMEKGWTEGADGYWYHNAAVDSEKESQVLVSSLGMSEKAGNIYQNSEVLIEARAEAVQIANNGKSGLEAIGWPAGLDKENK